MQTAVPVAENLYWIGGNDRRISLFEGLFPVPRGMSYNAYVLIDEKTVLFDTVDSSVGDTFLEGLERVLAGRTLDYIVIHHMEPDHSAAFLRTVEKYPNAKVVANKKIAQMLSQFYGYDGSNIVTVAENDTLCTGMHTLKFLFAPMVHWPEVMFTYDMTAGTLFSADAFGTFGVIDGNLFADCYDFEGEYLREARRYYTNIVGKYGVQVQTVLKKAAALDIRRICPLHGPVWRSGIEKITEKYDAWSSYRPEEKGIAIFYASIYGHTKNAAEKLSYALAEEGITNMRIYDVSVTDGSELLAQSFRFSHLVFASVTYNGSVFPKTENLLNDLKFHGLRGRKYSLIENGSWAPVAGKGMSEILSSMKDMNQIGETVTLLSSVKEEQTHAIRTLAKSIACDMNE